MFYAMGEIPVPVMLTRDQVRFIRGKLDAIPTLKASEIDELFAIFDALNAAETQATIQHAKGYSPVVLWE